MSEEEKIEKRLRQIYSRANKEIEAKADKYFARFARKDAEKKKLVESGEMDKSAYIEWRKQQMLVGKHWKTLRDESADILLRANEMAVAYVNGEMPIIYSAGYNEVADGINALELTTPFETVNAATVRNLAIKNETLLPYKRVDGRKDVRWNTQKINGEVLQGILQGESTQKIAARLGNVTKMNKESAMRNARTSITSAENKGRMDMLYEAADEGVIVKKQWLAAMDSRTREAHERLNGKEVNIDEPFDSELGEIMYPGDPDAAPANVYNCRCTLTYHVVGFKEAKFTYKGGKYVNFGR